MSRQAITTHAVYPYGQWGRQGSSYHLYCCKTPGLHVLNTEARIKANSEHMPASPLTSWYLCNPNKSQALIRIRRRFVSKLPSRRPVNVAIDHRRLSSYVSGPPSSNFHRPTLSTFTSSFPSGIGFPLGSNRLINRYPHRNRSRRTHAHERSSREPTLFWNECSSSILNLERMRVSGPCF